MNTLLLPFVVLCLFFGIACKTVDHSQLKSEIQEKCYINGASGPIGICQIKDGLYTLGAFDSKKPTVIFVHGWIPSFELGVPDFVNELGWHKAGFNTLIYRYIEMAVDVGEGETCRAAGGAIPLLDLFEIKCPKYAEQRVWREGGITDQFVNAYINYFSNKDDYKQEVRIVGHSLGGQIAISSSYAIYLDSNAQVKPTRVEIIDPWVGYENLDTGKLTGTMTKYFPQFENTPNSKCNSKNTMTSYCALESGLMYLKKNKVALVIYGSNSAGAFGFDLRNNFNYQAFNEDWLCDKDIFFDKAKCLARGFSMFTAQHFFPLFSYFWSIDESVPENGITARTPTADLINNRTFRKQSANKNWCKLPQSVVFWKEGGLNHIFGMSRYPGDENQGFQDTADSKEDFVRRMVENLPFDEDDARQCANAISFENDVFEIEDLK